MHAVTAVVKMEHMGLERETGLDSLSCNKVSLCTQQLTHLKLVRVDHSFIWCKNQVPKLFLD